MPEDRLWSLLAATDICVSLRYPTMGETSGVGVRALEAGRPQVVSDVGWFSELPDEVALKVPVGDDEVEVLAGHLTRLAGDAERAGARWAPRPAPSPSRSTTSSRVADAYAATLEEAAGGEAVRGAVAAAVASAAAEVGLEPERRGRGRDRRAPARGRPWPLSAP